ncbi:hypothetical protein SLS64_014119, partial [Diaporthe eres]
MILPVYPSADPALVSAVAAGVEALFTPRWGAWLRVVVPSLLSVLGRVVLGVWLFGGRLWERREREKENKKEQRELDEEEGGAGLPVAPAVL